MIISIFAFGIRLIVSGILMKSNIAVLHPAPSSDLYTYMQLSRAIVNGEFAGPLYYQPFYYAAFLPAVIYLFGKSIIVVIIAQAFVGALTVFTGGMIGKIVQSRSVGIVTSLALAIANTLIFYTPYHKIATLQTFNVTLFSLFFVLALKASTKYKSFVYYALTGLFMGVACATRGNIYLLLFGILPLIFCKGIIEKRKVHAMINIVLVTTFIIIAQLPFIIYNTIECGKLTAASTASGAVLALGNTPEAPAGGRDYFAGNGPMEYPESYELFMRREATGVRSVPLQIMDYFLDKPLEYIELSWRKVLLFWSWGEIPNNVSYYEGKNKSDFLKYNFLGESLVLMIFGLAGVFYTLKRNFKKRDYAMLGLLVVLFFYHLSIAFFYNLGRFRAPIFGVLAVFAGIFIVEMWQNLREWSRLKFNILALAGSIYLVLFAYSVYQKGWESIVMNYVRPHGTKIKLIEPNSYCIFDYGPRSFGAWQGFMIEKGVKVEKTFDVEDKNATGTLKFMLNAKGGHGIATIRINGKNSVFDLQKSDQGFFTVPVTLQNGKVELELMNFYGGISELPDLAIDKQREYSRSKYNGEVLPFEWIMRFYFEEK